MIEIGNLLVEPEMDAGDGRVLEVADLLTNCLALSLCGQKGLKRIKGEREDEIVERLFRSFLSSHSHSDLRVVDAKSFHGTTEMQRAAMGSNVFSRGVIQVSERESGHAHVTSGGGLHGLAHDLGCCGDGDPVYVLAKSADQDGMPEALDSILGLTVRIEPLLERLPVVALYG